MHGERDVLTGLLRSYLFENLTPDELAPLAATVCVREFGRGEHVWQAGDPADEIYVVLSGEVKDAVVDPDGGEVVHFVHGPGMTFGEPGFFAVDRHRVVATIVIEPAALIRLPRRELQPFLDRYPVVKDRVLERLASDMRWLSAMLVSQARRSLADRVGLRLLEMIDSDASHGDGLVVTPKISQGVLAAMVGVTRENVNRALAGLTADGLIRQERGRYVIVDEATLRARVDRQWPSARRRDRRMM